ncbi:MAG TPA: hypothetical protein VJU86_09845 [Pyrinomonadaceae bacterium]|nr:hypothetical protein [Pyrinomonadaceae bacterium]
MATSLAQVGQQICHVVLAITAVVSWVTLANSQETFTSRNAFLKTQLKANDRLSTEAKGDLNADGLVDWVVVIRSQEPDTSPTYEMFVLLRQAASGFRLAERTQKAESPGMGCCWLEDLTIRGGSIFVQNNAKTASVMEAATHQFKWYKGEWRLVGLTVYLTDHTPGSPSTKDTEMNLLTGLIIEKTRKGNRPARTQRSSREFPVALLKDFDFSNGFGAE